MSFKIDGFSEGVKSFAKEHKVLCALTLGLGIVGFSGIANRPVAWLCQYFGMTEKTASVGHGKIVSLNNTSEIDKTLNEATKNRGELAEIRKKAIADLQDQKPAAKIAGQISTGMKKFIARLYEEGERKLGPPPGGCRYCVAGLGSLARNESGTYPDYDNFIIIENESPEIRRYFTQLNQYVADRIVRLGEEKGFHLCEGNLNSPYQKYKHRYADDETLGLRGRQELLTSPNNIQVPLGDIADSAPIFGDTALYEEFMTQALQKESTETMAYKNIKRNVDGINEDKNPSPITAPKLPEMIHVKEQLFRLPQAIITGLSLFYGIKEKNSIERIEELRKKGVFSTAFAERLTVAVEYLIKFRIQAQSAHGEELEFVSTSCNWESFEKNNEAIKAKLKEVETKIDHEEKKLGKTFKELVKTLKNCEKKIKKLETQNSKDIDVQNLIALEKCKNEKNELQEKLKGFWELNGLKEYYQDLLNPKIAKNQYSDQMRSKHPNIVAFTEADKKLLEDDILPTLRDLFAMATESIKDGKLDSTAFSKK